MNYTCKFRYSILYILKMNLTDLKLELNGLNDNTNEYGDLVACISPELWKCALFRLFSNDIRTAIVNPRFTILIIQKFSS